MEKLIRLIEEIQSKLDGLRKRSLKEMSTRTIIIDPLLVALGWDVRDLDEVQLEYPTVDGKSVDYALLLNNKPALLVEAKALDDPLNDVKGITQVVGYAANAGIVWCVLTNGVVWRVYRSIEECPAPEKLMFEVSLDPRSPEGLPLEQIAGQMWRFSREEMAKGTLDTIREQTFTDGKVRKALDAILRDAPRALLKIVGTAAGDDELTPQRIKESLARIWAQSTGALSAAAPELASGRAGTDQEPSTRSRRWMGLPVTKIIRYCASRKLSREQTIQFVRGPLKLTPAKTTIRNHFNAGLRGEDIPTLDPEQMGAFDTLLEALRGGSKPGT